jgi:hypothetical protein
VNRYSKYSLQSALDLTDGFCRYLIQDRCWGPQEILDAEAVVYDLQADAEQMLRECIAYGDPAVVGRLRYFLAEDCRVHFVHKMDDRRVVSETARQLSQYSYQVVLEPGLGWAVQVDATTAAPIVPVAVEPEPEVTGALAELKVVLDELVSEQGKKYAHYEAKLATLSEADKAALYGQKAGAGLWDATIGGAVGLVKALPGFAAGYFKTLSKIAMLPSELASATARSIATGDMAPLKAEADKFVQPLVKTYDQAVHYKSVLVTLYEDEQTMGLLNDFAQDYWDATHPLERTEMGASAAADIVVTVLLALVTAGVGAAANIASKSARLAKAAKLLDKIAGMLKRTGHRHKMPKKDVDAVTSSAKVNKTSGKAAKGGVPDPEKPKVRESEGVENSRNKVDDAADKADGDNKQKYKNTPPSDEDISLAKKPGNTAEQITARKNVAAHYYEKQGMKESKISGHMQGIDFDKPVEVEQLSKGQFLAQYQIPGGPQGNYYSPLGQEPGKLGISEYAQDWNTGEIVKKKIIIFEVNKDVDALASKAAKIKDTWSIPGKSISTDGGGKQFFTTNKSSFTLVGE